MCATRLLLRPEVAPDVSSSCMLLTLHKHGYWNVSFLPWKCITYVAVCPVTHSSRHSSHLKITSAGLCAASRGALRRQPSRPLYTLCCRHYFLPSNKSMFALNAPSWRLCLLRCGSQTMKIQMWSTGRGARGRCKGLGMRWGGGINYLFNFHRHRAILAGYWLTIA